jgi:hypothetical protein
MDARMVEVVLPFSGFYESLWSEGIDRECDSFVEYDPEREPGYRYFPDAMPDHERNRIMFGVTNFRAAYQDVARQYVRAFNVEFTELLGFDPGFVFEELVIPREYNFTSDRIFVKVPLLSLAAMIGVVGLEAVSDIAREEFRPRSGFIPFSVYREGDIGQWQSDLGEWDHNMLGCIIRAVIDGEYDGDWSDFVYAIYDRIDFCAAWDKSVDFLALKREVAAWVEKHEGSSNAD